MSTCAYILRFCTIKNCKILIVLAISTCAYMRGSRVQAKHIFRLHKQYIHTKEELVFDHYIKGSLKATTREARGTIV